MSRQHAVMNSRQFPEPGAVLTSAQARSPGFRRCGPLPAASFPSGVPAL